MVLVAGVPSSSNLKEPRLPASVASSTTVTNLEATCLPSMPVNLESPCPARSASRPCPMASCIIVPPASLDMTTGILPPGALRAPSIITARLAASSAASTSDFSSKSSKPFSPPSTS